MTKRMISLVLIGVLALGLFIPAASADTMMFVYTANRKSLNVRSAPVVADNIIGSFKYGETVSVVATSTNGWSTIWWQTASGEFTYAYVQSRYLVKTMPSSGGSSSSSSSGSSTDASKALSDMNTQFRTAKAVAHFTIVARPTRATGWVNMRWAPSMETEVITQCKQGKELTVLAELRDWYQVQDPVTGMIGFISRKYVSAK